MNTDRLTRGVTALAALASLSSLAGATVVAPVSFSTAADFTGRFRTTFTTSGSSFAQNSANGSNGQAGVLRFTSASGSSVGVALYDSNAGAAGTDTFSEEIAQADFRIGQTGGSFALLLRVSSDDKAGYVAVVNVNGGTGLDQMRLFKAAGISPTSNLNAGNVGTQLVTQQTTNSLDINQFYTMKFSVTNTSPTSVQLNAAVYALGGSTPLAGMSVTPYTDSTSPFLSAGQVGFRVGSLTSNNVSDVDNFTIIPEPTSLGMIAGAASLVVLRRRRA